MRRIAWPKRLASVLATATALAGNSAVAAKATLRERQVFAESLALAAFRAGADVALACLLALMRLAGIDRAWACGCRIGAFGSTRCAEHERAKRERDKRVELHRTCPCGLRDELTKMSAVAAREGRTEDHDKLRRARAAHVCPGKPWDWREEEWREARAAEQERLWGMLT